MANLPEPVPPLPTHCPNCQAAVHGPYCAQCGQETVIGRLKLRDFSHEYFQNFVSLEGRLWRSLWILVSRPGQLTLEFLAGRRRRYVRPIPLYLSLSFVMFLLLAFSSADSLIKLDGEQDISILKDVGSQVVAQPGHQGPPPPVKPGDPARDSAAGLDEVAAMVAKLPAPVRPLGQRYYEAAKRLRDDPKGAVARLTQAATAKLPYAVFLLVPVFALTTRVLYWRRPRLYSEHLLFALHLHAFVFLTLIAGYWLAADTVAPVLFWSWWIYLTLALRRVFGGRWWAQTARALFVMVGHSVLLAVAALLTLIASLPSV